MLNVTALSGFGGAKGDVTSWRFFQIKTTAVDGSSTYTGMAAFKIFVDSTEHPTSTMTSNSLPSPLVASATGEGSSDEAFRAFDSVLNTHWQFNSVSMPIFLRIDLGAGNEIGPTSYKLTSPETADRVPKNFTFEASNTGSFTGEEVVLDTQTNQTSWGARTERTFTL